MRRRTSSGPRLPGDTAPRGEADEIRDTIEMLGYRRGDPLLALRRRLAALHRPRRPIESESPESANASAYLGQASTTVCMSRAAVSTFSTARSKGRGRR